MLEYKRIGSEEHLTFDSIQKLAFDHRSHLGEKKSRQHLRGCSKCGGIYKSLTSPQDVRKAYNHRKVKSQLFSDTMVTMGLIASMVSLLYFSNSLNLKPEDLSILISQGLSKIKNSGFFPHTPDKLKVLSTAEFQRKAVEVKADSSQQVPESPEKFMPAQETEQRSPDADKPTVSSERLQEETINDSNKGIYGKITATGKPLQGVTVMQPGGRNAKVSNSSGNYYIKVPQNTSSLLVIYQGRQTLIALDSDSKKLDIDLSIENMAFPEIEIPETDISNIVSN